MKIRKIDKGLYQGEYSKILRLHLYELEEPFCLEVWHSELLISTPLICNHLTLNAPVAAKVVCFSRLMKCLRSLNGKQCGPRSDCSYIGAVCSGSMLFASILNSSVILGNYLQQTTSTDDIFRCIFSWRFKG